MSLIVILIGLLLGWTVCCVTAGLIWAEHERRKAEQAEYDARDQWANEYEQRQQRNKGVNIA